MPFEALVEDVLLRILSFCDISTGLAVSAVNKTLRRIALSKQLWLALVLDARIRDALDLPPPDREKLECLSTEELIDVVKNAVAGPGSVWDENEQPPSVTTTSFEISLDDMALDMRFGLPVAHLLPGARYILIHSRAQQALCIYDVWSSRRVWHSPVQAQTLWRVDLVPGGAIARVFDAQLAVIPNRNTLHVDEIDLATGASHELFNFSFASTVFRIMPSAIVGDFLLCTVMHSYSHFNVLTLVLINWHAMHTGGYNIFVHGIQFSEPPPKPVALMKRIRNLTNLAVLLASNFVFKFSMAWEPDSKSKTEGIGEQFRRRESNPEAPVTPGQYALIHLAHLQGVYRNMDVKLRNCPLWHVSANRAHSWSKGKAWARIRVMIPRCFTVVDGNLSPVFLAVVRGVVLAFLAGQHKSESHASKEKNEPPMSGNGRELEENERWQHRVRSTQTQPPSLKASQDSYQSVRTCLPSAGHVRISQELLAKKQHRVCVNANHVKSRLTKRTLVLPEENSEAGNRARIASHFEILKIFIYTYLAMLQVLPPISWLWVSPKCSKIFPAPTTGEIPAFFDVLPLASQELGTWIWIQDTSYNVSKSRLKISGRDIAHWRIDAAEGVGGRREGIPAQMNLSFVLDEKPAIFQYRFYAVSTDAKGNPKTRSGGSLEIQEGKWKVLEWVNLSRTLGKNVVVVMILVLSDYRMPPTTAKLPTGPPQALIEHINYLNKLLTNLPPTLPLGLTNAPYHFFLDEDCVTFAGAVFPEAQRVLEASFETWQGPALIPFLKSVDKRMTPGERNVFEAGRMDKLINGAKDSEAVVPSRTKRRKTTSMVMASILSSIPKQMLAPNVTIPSTVDVNLTKNQQATLTGMGWQGWAPRAKEAHQKEMAKRHREGIEDLREKQEKYKPKKQQRTRELAAERQRQHRAKKKAENDQDSEDLPDDKNANVVWPRGADALARERVIDVPEISRAGTQGWRMQRNGTRGGAVQKKAVSMNYFNPFLFMHIDKAMVRTGWSPTAAVDFLQHEHPVLYKSLRKGTISRWQVKGKKEWSAAMMAKVTAGRAIAASGHTGILAPCPDITNQVKETLRGLRTAGTTINVSIVRGVPFFRLHYAILTGAIPPELIINADQAGNYLLPASSHTFHDRGAKQVDLVAKDEKRAYTMMLASTPAGDFLPIQAVWAGKTGGSLPTKNAEKMQEAREKGQPLFDAKHNETWVEGILVTWRDKIITRDDLDPDQLMVAYIDIYPVHTGKPFWTLIFTDFPFIILIFVPNGCTGLFQPADVGLQRVAKHILKQDSLDYLVDVFQNQRKQGTAPKDVKFPSSLPVLRDTSVRGLVKIFAKALQKFLCEDTGTTLATEIANCCGAAHLARALEPLVDKEEGLAEEEEGNFDSNDDSDVCLPAVVGDALGICVDVEDFSQHAPVTHQAARCPTNDGLVALDESENMWAYTDDGQLWHEVKEVESDDSETQSD
ncbi:hypothetical protein C8R45DRAFT_1164232 [Mycena sanguinolenta]|nr:hypothetical protein C8R45DRAFT_1164232 [Mycena sanguinolenta]